MLMLCPFSKAGSPYRLLLEVGWSIRRLGVGVEIVRPARTEPVARHMLGSKSSPGRLHVIACRRGQAVLAWFEDDPVVEQLMLRVVADLDIYGPVPPVAALSATTRRIGEHRLMLKRIRDERRPWIRGWPDDMQGPFATLCAYMAGGIAGGYAHEGVSTTAMTCAQELRKRIGIGEDAAKHEMEHWLRGVR